MNISGVRPACPNPVYFLLFWDFIRWKLETWTCFYFQFLESQVWSLQFVFSQSQVSCLLLWFNDLLFLESISAAAEMSKPGQIKSGYITPETSEKISSILFYFIWMFLYFASGWTGPLSVSKVPVPQDHDTCLNVLIYLPHLFMSLYWHIFSRNGGSIQILKYW